MKHPKTWTPGTLDDVIASVRGGFSVQCEDRIAEDTEIGVLKTGAVLTGTFDPTQNKFVPPQERSRTRTPVSANTIIICRKNSEETIGANAFVAENYDHLFLSDLLWELSAAKHADIHWLSHVLHSGYVRSMIRLWSTGTQSTMKNISQDRLLAIPISIPKKDEQKKIATILRTWDEAIDKSSSLLSSKRTHFASARRGSIEASCKLARGPVPLGRISARVRRKNNGQAHPVMTISAKSGFLLQSDKYSRDMAGSSLEHYTLLRQGEFAYNKGNSLTSPQGCLFRLEQDSALVPHVYFCFSLAEKAFSDFYVHVFESGYLNHQLFRVINSGVRNDGLLNLAPEDFFRCTVPSPPHDEQVRIARTLDALKSEIRLYERQLELLQKQKRGLMQKLLTGEWRVKC